MNSSQFILFGVTWLIILFLALGISGLAMHVRELQRQVSSSPLANRETLTDVVRRTGVPNHMSDVANAEIAVLLILDPGCVTCDQALQALHDFPIRDSGLAKGSSRARNDATPVARVLSGVP